MRPAALLRPLRRVEAYRAPSAWSRTFASRVRFPTRSERHQTASAEGRTSFHRLASRQRRLMGHNQEEVPEQPPTTDFNRMDMLGAVPVPSTSIDICFSSGFQLNSGLRVVDGSGILLVGGDAFAWRPWGPGKRLVNPAGQWEVDRGAFEVGQADLLDCLGDFGITDDVADLLVLGLGPEMRPLSPDTKRHISSLGMRVEVLDTRNAASQFNLLATERGVSDVAAAMIPVGWREGYGAQ